LKDTHDFYRIYHDGRGSFDTIMKNIPKFKKIFGGDDFVNDTGTRGRLNLHGSLNKKTVASMYESWRFFQDELKIPAVWFMPIQQEDWNDEDAVIYEEQTLLIINDSINNAIATNNISPINDYSPINKCINSRSHQSVEFNKSCGAGAGFISIVANGDIFPCHHIYTTDSNTTKIGNLDDGIDDRRRMLYLLMNGKESNCAKLGCTNFDCYRCFADNYAITGTIFNTDINPRCTMSTAEKRIMARTREILKNKGLLR
jgi:uncharacterized protein